MPARVCDLCQRPTRNAAYVCEACADLFAAALRDLDDWLDAELETSLHGTKGIEYKHGRLGGGGGDGGLRVNWGVGELRNKLVLALDALVWHCDRQGIASTSTKRGRPMRQVDEMATWLRWRVDGLCLDPDGPRLMDRVTGLAARARTLVDRPPSHSYLGQCDECKRGRIYAIGDAWLATCEVCRAEYSATERREWMLAELEDRLVTAAEAAHLSTYLGLKADRDKVRKRINTWHARGRVEAQPSVTGETVFRFGDVYSLLMAEDCRP